MLALRRSRKLLNLNHHLRSLLHLAPERRVLPPLQLDRLRLHEAHVVQSVQLLLELLPHLRLAAQLRQLLLLLYQVALRALQSLLDQVLVDQQRWLDLHCALFRSVPARRSLRVHQGQLVQHPFSLDLRVRLRSA